MPPPTGGKLHDLPRLWARSAFAGEGRTPRPLQRMWRRPALLPQLSLFDAGARFECREPIAEPVRDKAAANHCEHFAPNTKVALTGASKSRTAADDARKAFEQLFKKKS